VAQSLAAFVATNDCASLPGGRKIVVARSKLVAINSAGKNRVPGKLAGKISYTPNAFDPLADQEIADLGFEKLAVE